MPSAISAFSVEKKVIKAPKWWAAMEHRERHRWVYNKVSRIGLKEFFENRRENTEGAVLDRPANFGKLNRTDRAEVTEYWMLHGS